MPAENPWQPPVDLARARPERWLRGARPSGLLVIGVAGLLAGGLAVHGHPTALFPIALFPAAVGSILGTAMLVAPGRVDPILVPTRQRSMADLLRGLEPWEHALWTVAGVCALTVYAGTLVLVGVSVSG